MLKHHSRRVKTFILGTAISTCFLLPLPQQSSAQEESYKVAEGDTLSITVYGDAGLSGVFPVGPGGTIGYPILGNIPVEGHTLDEISNQINNGLKPHIPNLSAAVAIKEYAPVFIMGDVQKPGKFEFRPGMIALELFALGGGLREPTVQTDTSGVQLINVQQEYEDLTLQLLSLDVKRVRLEAEFNDKPFDYPITNQGALRDPATLQSIVDSERNLYQQRLTVMQSDRTNLQDQRQNFAEEIDMLNKSTDLRNQQFDLLKLDVDASQGLVTRGAASETVLRERKRELLQMNQQLLEFGSYLARAKQSKNEVERRLQDLDSKRKGDAVTELRQVNLDMLRIRKKMEYNVQVMAEISAAARRVTDRSKIIQTEFSVVRLTDGQYEETTIDEHTQVQPGDLIRVRLVGPDPTITVGSAK
ncbi:polysaccharide biosynthesis/export family protein [Rhizobium sp. BK376]|uniref:polysaccharide biosynthesis/export family protein n=1 Tax=Rhizobium sp. BK376 TaxID=2512149 RepID=UPI001042B0CD|nr:polysaccharide biosynthesis/export family protein [Rhizobium sp. BK376]